MSKHSQKSKQSFYDILNISKNANDDDIRKAYKTLALKWHPDRNRDNQEEANLKFQEINKAYNVLSDDRKRQIYDQLGEEGLEGVDATGGGGFNPSDIFSQFFSGSGGGGGGGFSFFGNNNGPNSTEHKQTQASPQKEVQIKIELTKCYKGGKQDITLTKIDKCNDCDGIGCKTSEDIVNCQPCNGKGVNIQIQKTPFGIQQMHSTCRKCQGKGKAIKTGSECAKCNGQKSVKVNKKYTVDIPAGAIDGFPITIVGESDWMPDYGFVGDLILFVSVTIPSNCIFKREGHNLIINKQISLFESLCGVHFGVRHMDDRILEIKWDRIIKPGDSLVVKREGLPICQSSANSVRQGDLILRFEVIYPNECLDTSTKLAIKTALTNSQTPTGQHKSLNINMFALYEQIRVNPVLKDNVKIIEAELSREHTFNRAANAPNTSPVDSVDFENGGFSFMSDGGNVHGMGGRGMGGRGMSGHGMGIPGNDMQHGVQCAQQ